MSASESRRHCNYISFENSFGSTASSTEKMQFFYVSNFRKDSRTRESVKSEMTEEISLWQYFRCPEVCYRTGAPFSSSEFCSPECLRLPPILAASRLMQGLIMNHSRLKSAPTKYRVQPSPSDLTDGSVPFVKEKTQRRP